MALRLANADVLPFDFRSYATALGEFTTEVERRWTDRQSGGDTQASPFAPVHAAVTRFAAAAERAGGRADSLLQGNREDQTALNRALMGVERALTDPDGIPGRPWYRHQIYAPKFTYAPEILPGPAEAIAAGDGERVRQQCARVAAAISRAAEVLER
jgi:N-acetylated-alpha-linked acidic dipeptidase